MCELRTNKLTLVELFSQAFCTQKSRRRHTLTAEDKLLLQKVAPAFNFEVMSTRRGYLRLLAR